jgi:hypothetical protein
VTIAGFYDGRSLGSLGASDSSITAGLSWGTFMSFRISSWTCPKTETIGGTFKDWIKADPIKPLHQTHARFALYGINPAGADDPGVVGHLLGNERLLDGYHRAVRFWCTRPNAAFRVWRPK